MFFDLKKIIDHIQRIWESINTWHVLLWIHFLVVTVIIVIYYWNAILLNYHKKIRWWLINHAMFACDQSLCRRVVQCAVCWNGRGNVWHSSSKMSTNCVSVNNTFTSLITGKTVSQCLVNISLVSCAFSALTLLVGHQEEHPTCKIEWWGVDLVICLEWGGDCLHMVQLMPLPSQNPTVSCLL